MVTHLESRQGFQGERTVRYNWMCSGEFLKVSRMSSIWYWGKNLEFSLIIFPLSHIYWETKWLISLIIKETFNFRKNFPLYIESDLLNCLHVLWTHKTVKDNHGVAVAIKVQVRQQENQYLWNNSSSAAPESLPLNGSSSGRSIKVSTPWSRCCGLIMLWCICCCWMSDGGPDDATWIRN